MAATMCATGVLLSFSFFRVFDLILYHCSHLTLIYCIFNSYVWTWIKNKLRKLSQSVAIEQIKDFQQKCLMSLQSREDAFLSSKTSSGKSVCYQDFPALLYMCLYNAVCNVIVIVIEPLVAIISKQMNLLQDTGYRSLLRKIISV